MPTSLELSISSINPESSVNLNTTYDLSNDQVIEQNINDTSMNQNETNSSIPKIQFNIGDSANHPVATITPLESEVDSGFISSEAANVPELSNGLNDTSDNVKFADEDVFEEVSVIF